MGTESIEDTSIRQPYVESPIIMATVRVLAPFVLTFGLFVIFHGADTSGGGFQGGVIIGTVILMLGIAFGIRSTRDWIGPRIVVSVTGIGVSLFLLVGFGTIFLGGNFLEYSSFEIAHASKYGIEVVELAIGIIVSSIIVGLFFSIEAGEAPDARSRDPDDHESTEEAT